MVLGLAMYAREWAAFTQAVAKSGVLLQPETFRATLLNILGELPDERAAHVLATCCTLVGGRAGDFHATVCSQPGLAVDLAMASLSQVNASRVFEWAGGYELGTMPLDEVEQAAEGKPTQEVSNTDLDLTVHGLARDYGCSPADVMQWPVEVFIQASELAADLRVSTIGVPGERVRQSSPTGIAAMMPGFTVETKDGPSGA